MPLNGMKSRVMCHKLVFDSCVIMISHIEVQIRDRLIYRQIAIFERVPLPYIQPRYFSASATTTNVFFNNCSDLNPVSAHTEQDSKRPAFTK